MFTNCSSLKNGPDLPAETLASNCYTHMFSSCPLTSLRFNFSNWGTTDDKATYYFLNAGNLDFYCPSALDTTQHDDNAIPSAISSKITVYAPVKYVTPTAENGWHFLVLDQSEYEVAQATPPQGVTMYNGVQSVKSDDETSADMRFFWTINLNGLQPPEKLGVYFFDWEAITPVSGLQPSVETGQTANLKDGNIFYGTIIGITDFAKRYYALPIVNDKPFLESILSGTVNETDINQ